LVVRRVVVQKRRFPFGLRKGGADFRPFKKPLAAQGIYSDDPVTSRCGVARSLRHYRHAQI
jgi:hypothetical protein